MSGLTAWWQRRGNAEEADACCRPVYDEAARFSRWNEAQFARQSTFQLSRSR